MKPLKPLILSTSTLSQLAGFLVELGRLGEKHQMGNPANDLSARPLETLETMMLKHGLSCSQLTLTQKGLELICKFRSIGVASSSKHSIDITIRFGEPSIVELEIA